MHCVCIVGLGISFSFNFFFFLFLYLMFDGFNFQLANYSAFLWKAISADQLSDDEEYVEILEDMKDECSKFGIHIT